MHKILRPFIAYSIGIVLEGEFMTYIELLEIVVCVLAVYGFYALICHLLAFICPKGDLSIGVHIRRGEKLTPQEDLQYAKILSEEHRGHLQPPVFLLDEAPDRECVAMLRETGHRIYRLLDDE